MRARFGVRFYRSAEEVGFKMIRREVDRHISLFVGGSDLMEVTVSTMVSKRRSSFGMSCAQCDNELMAPEWSEHRNNQKIHHLWHCWKCDCYFESIVNVKLMEDNAAKYAISRSRLIA